MKWNEVKYILFNKIYINLQQFQVIPENKTRKLNKPPNIHDKKGDKDKESKIVKKWLRWINLLVVSKDKCNNGTKREKSTGNLPIITMAYLIYQGQKEKVCPLEEWWNLNLIFF